MSRNSNRISHTFQLYQKHRIRWCYIPKFHQIRTSNSLFQFSHLQPSQLFSLLFWELYFLPFSLLQIILNCLIPFLWLYNLRSRYFLFFLFFLIWIISFVCFYHQTIIMALEIVKDFFKIIKVFSSQHGIYFGLLFLQIWYIPLGMFLPIILPFDHIVVGHP